MERTPTQPGAKFDGAGWDAIPVPSNWSLEGAFVGSLVFVFLLWLTRARSKSE